MLLKVCQVADALSPKWAQAASISVALAAALLITPVEAADTLFACFPNDGGRVRIVGSLAECTASEEGVSWNVQGPEGPQGPAGPAGPTGMTGATGPAGPQGEPAGVTQESLDLQLQALDFVLGEFQDRIFELEEQVLFLLEQNTPPKRVFVTSAPRDVSPIGFGGFNSIATADTICRSAAATAGLLFAEPGEPEPLFLAWLSAAESSGPSAAGQPLGRFSGTQSPIEDVNGNPIASSFADLINNGLDNPIHFDEFGLSRGLNQPVWTGTTPSGMATGDDCESWQTTNASATVGITGLADNGWTDAGLTECSVALPFYCFEQ